MRNRFYFVLVIMSLLSNRVLAQYECFFPDTNTFPREITENGECGNYLNYIPTEQTSILEVKINFHFFRNDDGTGIYQPSDSLQIDTLVGSLNWIYGNLQPPTIAPPQLSDTLYDTKIRFKLQGVYYHDNTYFYNSYNQSSNSIFYDTYGINKYSEINVFFYLDSYYAVGGGRGRPFYINLHNVPVSEWASAQLLAHELGHSLGLLHTWDDLFDDTFYPDNNREWLMCNDSTITNNIMGYNICRDYLSPKQIGTIHYGLLSNDSRRKLLTGARNTEDTVIHITQPQIINHCCFFDKDVVIDSNFTLTVNCKVYIAGGSRIIVRPGGKLIVNGGTLTSACDGEMWQGIIVEGNRALRQTGSNQGSVILTDAIIENAREAISTHRADDSLWVGTGGIVQATNTLFRNNRRSVATAQAPLQRFYLLPPTRINPIVRANHHSPRQQKTNKQFNN